MSRRLAGAALAASALIAWGEFAHWRASRRLVYPDHGGSEAIVVLGFRNKNQRRANVINRWRVRAGLRSIDPNASATRLVFCGGSVAGMRSEADLMARYARIECGFSGDSVLEDRSRSTWENVANAIPLIEGADRIKIVSNSPHAYIARQYLARQRPDLAVRAVRADDYRLGEWALLKPLFAAYSLLHTLSHSDWHP